MKVLYSTWRLGLAMLLSLFAGTQLSATTCAQAVVVSSLPYSAAVVCSGANDITSTNAAVCAPASSLYYGGQEALLTYTPSVSGDVTIDYSGQTWTGIMVYSGCPTSGGACVGGISSSTSAKSLTVSMNAGTQYYIMIDTWPSPPSPCPGTVTITGAAPPPPAQTNDLCVDAEPISCGQTITGTTVGATADNAPFCGTSNTSPGVWYTFTGAGRIARVSTCGSGFDTKLTVYTGSCDALVCVAGNDDACGLQSIVEFPAEPGVQYLVLVHGFSSATGNYTLSLECGILPPPPVPGCTDPTAINYNPNATVDDGSCEYAPPPPPVTNDVCADAILMSCGETVFGSTLDATGTGQPTAFCGTTPGSFGTWYRFVGTGEIVTVSTCNPGTDFDTKLNVYSGSCGSLVCVGGNDDTTDPSCQLPPNNFNRKSRVIFTSTAGTTYYFLVTGFSTARGNYELSVSCAPAVILGCTDPNAVNYNPNATVDDGSCVYPPANDLCANAMSISCGQTASGTTIGATPDNAPFCGTSNTSPGVWYTFLGAGRSATVSTCNQANFDTKISVFSGSCGGLVCVAGNDDAAGCGLTSSVTFPAAPGVRYYVLVHGFSSATGNFSLTLTCGVNPIVQDDPGNTVASGKIALFPNPARDVVNVNVSDFIGRTAIATVFNNVGQKVQQVNLGEIQIPTERIELGNLAAGMYYLSLNVEGDVFTEKFIVNGNRP